MSPQRLFLIEFNELCPSLLDRFIGQGHLPNFQRLHEGSRICTTDAGERPPHLEPWIQWPTLHFGVPYAKHKCFRLGDGRAYHGKGIAEILSDAGIRVGVCGSMNVNYGKLNGYLLPDPWDTDGRAHPDWLQSYYETVSGQVQESSREGAGPRKDLLRLGRFMLGHGLRPSTMRTILAQLVAERRDPGLKWRRAVLLDAIQYDLFRYLNRRFDIQFATFFCNSTAHFQHYFWRNMEPEMFEAPPPESDHPSLRGAILYGYRSMDRIVGRFLKDYPDAVLVLATALSQKPWVETTKCTYRPIRFEDLLEFAGASLPASAFKPVMAEEFTIECPDETMAIAVENALKGLFLDGRPLMKAERTGASVFAGCLITSLTAADQPVVRGHDGAARPFGELFYMVHSMRSGRHHPDGVLWFHEGHHRAVTEKLPLTDVAPMILGHFGAVMPEEAARPSSGPRIPEPAVS